MSVGIEYDTGEAELRFIHRNGCQRDAAHKGDADCAATAIVVMPHQCEEFSVGTVDGVRRLIADLQALVAKMSERS